MTTPGVDFFRVDRSGATRRLLVTGVLLVTAGATAVGAHLVHRLPDSVSRVVSLAGGVTVIGGLVLAFGSLAMMLFENVYMSIRDDGLLLHDNGKETVIAWDELTKVAVDAPHGLVELHRAGDKEVLRWHAGKAAKDVAGRIEEAKRKAAHGLLRTSNPPSSPPAQS
jgi:hypothetical protein